MNFCYIGFTFFNKVIKNAIYNTETEISLILHINLQAQRQLQYNRQLKTLAKAVTKLNSSLLTSNRFRLDVADLQRSLTDDRMRPEGPTVNSGFLANNQY